MKYAMIKVEPIVKAYAEIL